MPQLVKRGKHVFGWSLVGDTGRIMVPHEALDEYRFEPSEKLIAMPGSQRSGGFGLGSRESVSNSPLGGVLEVRPELGEFRIPEGEAVECEAKQYCWVQLRDREITIPPETLRGYGVRPGDRLLAIRGSGLAIGFAVRGPIVAEATRHPELVVFEPEAQNSSG
jgi:bifunctional DNA-binding transcriptional regulator/antitoxin component of YhaV-PrlF toxin-antitoxin module